MDMWSQQFSDPDTNYKIAVAMQPLIMTIKFASVFALFQFRRWPAGK